MNHLVINVSKEPIEKQKIITVFREIMLKKPKGSNKIK